MATRMITRTVTITTCTVMGVDVPNAKVENTIVKLSGNYIDANEALKVIKKLYETDDYKPTVVTGMETTEILYGMSEEDFIKYAEILPPRKVYND